MLNNTAYEAFEFDHFSGFYLSIFRKYRLEIIIKNYNKYPKLDFVLILDLRILSLRICKYYSLSSIIL